MLRHRFRFALCLTVLCAAIASPLGQASAIASPARTAAASGLSCGAEDGPSWSWSQCGNRMRGVVTLYGNRTVVGPCRFARLWRAGHLRYSVRVQGVTYRHLLPRLRGDGWALRHGCSRARNPATRA